MNKEISLKNVSLVKSNNNKRIDILNHISLEIPRNSIYTIVGPSGSGKSSLLLLLNRLSELSEGEIYIGNKEIRELEVIKLRRKVGIVFQKPTLFSGTVEENILYGPKLASIKDKSIAAKMINLVGLDLEFLQRDVDDLSGGEVQRVAIARAIANEPEILLLDEPTSALDPNSTKEIEGLILDLNRKLGLTVVWVTHDMEQAKRVGTHTMLLVKGNKVEENETAQFFLSPQTDEAREFLKYKENVI